MTYSIQQYKDALALVVLGGMSVLDDGEFIHAIDVEADGDGWNEPYSESYRCSCGQWNGISWIQADPDCSDRPDMADAVVVWMEEHIETEVYPVDNEGTQLL